MKKITLILVAGLMLFTGLLVSCGNPNSESFI